MPPGIPPLAWLAERALTQPQPRAITRTWPVALLAVVLCEALIGWSMLATQAAAFCRASGGNSAPSAALLDMFPEARGTTLEALCAGHASLAFGPMSGQSPTAGRYRSAILGPFSRPVGTRHIVGLEAGVMPADVARLTEARVRYVIWNRALPLPPALRTAAATVESVGGFIVVHLRE